MAKKAAVESVQSVKKDKQYEAMFLFGAGFAADVDKALGLARGILEKHGGTVLVAKKWDERKLHYEIGGNKRGVYVITYFTAPGASIGAIERDVNLSEDVLRVLVTDAGHLNKDEMEKVEPQPIIREERPSWERGGFEGGGRGGFGGDRGGGGGFDRGGDRGGDRGFDRGGDRPPRRDAGPRDEKPSAEPLPSSRE